MRWKRAPLRRAQPQEPARPLARRRSPSAPAWAEQLAPAPEGDRGEHQRTPAREALAPRRPYPRAPAGWGLARDRKPAAATPPLRWDASGRPPPRVRQG